MKFWGHDPHTFPVPLPVRSSRASGLSAAWAPPTRVDLDVVRRGRQCCCRAGPHRARRDRRGVFDEAAEALHAGQQPLAPDHPTHTASNGHVADRVGAGNRAVGGARSPRSGGPLHLEEQLVELNGGDQFIAY